MMRRTRLAGLCTALLLCGAQAGAQAPAVAARGAVTVQGGAAAPAPATPANPTGARFVESCQQAIESGVVPAGCQGPLYASEIERLKDDALRTQNGSLLTLLGDAYQSNRSGMSDIGQAYRWYLLGAVRGDARAMQRLSELYKDGRGAPQDGVKALGYARLAQRLAVPGSANARQAAAAIGSLGTEMATEELVLADRFASELESRLRRGAPVAARGAAPAVPMPGPGPGPGANLSNLPGLGAVQAHSVAEPPAPTDRAATPSPAR